jgi:hypothetical protein
MTRLHSRMYEGVCGRHHTLRPHNLKVHVMFTPDLLIGECLPDD